MSDDDALLDSLDRFGDARVLVLGDVMLDRYVYGVVERVSPEAPIPVMRVETERAMIGGAGNVARNVAGLGARAGLIGVVGEDESAAVLGDLLAGEERIAATLVPVAARRTSLKTRYVAGGQQLLRADRESTEPLAAASEAAVLAALEGALPGHGVLVLSDYAKGLFSEALLARAIALAGAAGVPVVADPKSRDLSRYRGASVLTPNRGELAAATGLPCGAPDEIVAAARAARAIAGVATLIVTLGPAGMVVLGADDRPLAIATVAREVFDVSGAGDTVAATLGTALAAGLPEAAAARLANLAAGLVVAKVGTAAVRRAELRAALLGEERRGFEAKLAGAEAAVEQVARWRRRGLRVGFTNGCFDLVHPGHVALLRQARAACDRLVVGLNSDASARRLKGEGRPVQPEAARAAVLASLEAVDLVVIFSQDTPLELIGALRPDLLVKGADYTLDRVVGAELVQSYGGRVLLAEIVPGHSTTATIARLAG